MDYNSSGIIKVWESLFKTLLLIYIFLYSELGFIEKVLSTNI